ncbi:MAG: hypothetical protein JNJ94_02770 [Chlorobi bacterium]|nr:hypothetical protein [Chlorobiota bacterium]
MKQLLLLALLILICGTTANAQKKAPLLFMDIPWGSSVSDVRKIVDSVEGIKFVEQRWGGNDNGDDDTTLVVLEYSNGKYAGYTAESLHFMFYNNRMLLVRVGYNLSGAEAIERWEKVVELLRAKFGKPKHDGNAFLSKMRKLIDDQELWDEHLSSELYLLSTWERIQNKHDTRISCQTGDKVNGVTIRFSDMTISKEHTQAEKKRKVKGM